MTDMEYVRITTKSTKKHEKEMRGIFYKSKTPHFVPFVSFVVSKTFKEYIIEKLLTC